MEVKEDLNRLILEKSGAKPAKNLQAEKDQDMIETCVGTLSLSFELGERLQVVMKIIDDREIESLQVFGTESGVNS